MAIIYIDSSATGLDDGTSWTNAYPSIPTAFSNGSAGDTFRLKHDHYEANTTTLTSPGINTNPCVLISCNANNEFVKATSVQYYDSSDLNLTGYLKCYGIYFGAGDDMFSNYAWSYTDSTLYMSGANSYLVLGGWSNVKLVRTSLLIPNATNVALFSTSGLSMRSVYIEDQPYVESARFFDLNINLDMNLIEVVNSDLSGITTLFGSAISPFLKAKFIRNKLKSNVVLDVNFGENSDSSLELFACDTGDGYHFFYQANAIGVVLESTTVKRVGGAQYDPLDNNTTFSAELQPNSNIIAYTQPLKYKLGEYKLDMESARTLTFYIMQQNSSATPANLTDHECWIEVSHPDATDLALGKTVSSQVADILETPIDLDMSGQTWTGSSGNVVTQQMSVTLPVVALDHAQCTVHIYLAKYDANVELFVCPKPSVS